MTTAAFLGRGFSFPFRIDATNTKPSFSEDEQLVKESIDSILNTEVGERPHRVQNGVPYGTRFRSLLFSDLEAAVDVAKYDARRALTAWEPRIEVLSVDVNSMAASALGTGIVVNITFRYRASNRVDNFVRPYRTEPITPQE